jgi:AcrR family transcriptional regulator
MPVQAGSTLDPEATKAKVLRAATELFYERGVHGVGVNEIAARANASKLSIYRYFHSKEGLVAAMLAQRSDDIHTWLPRQITGADPGRERVLALFDRLIRWFGEQGYRGCIVVNTAIDTRGADESVRLTARRHLARYRALLEAELRLAGIGEPETLTRHLLLLIEGATVITSVDGTPEAGHDARQAAETLLDAYARPDTAVP